MHEHITRALYYFDIHLLYASVVGLAAWALTSIPRWQRHHEVLDLGSDLAQFRSARGRSFRQVLVVPPFVGRTVGHHRRLREYHLSRPDRYHAFGSVVALRNPDVYAALFADTR